MSEIKGKICVVTGSNSGIGKETALCLANMGANVVMVVRNQERGEKAQFSYSYTQYFCSPASIEAKTKLKTDKKD